MSTDAYMRDAMRQRQNITREMARPDGLVEVFPIGQETMNDALARTRREMSDWRARWQHPIIEFPASAPVSTPGQGGRVVTSVADPIDMVCVGGVWMSPEDAAA